MVLICLFGLLLVMFLFSWEEKAERQRPVLEFDRGSPTESGSRFPFFYKDDRETLYMSWLGRVEEELFAMQFASWHNGRWQEPQTVYVGYDLYANWADFPSVVSSGGEVVAARWLRRVDGYGRAYEPRVSFPTDGPRRWSHTTPHINDTIVDGEYMSVVPLDPERVLAVWLENRQVDVPGRETDLEMSGTGMLRSAVVHRDGTTGQDTVIDEYAPVCCRPALTVAGGEVIAVYTAMGEDGSHTISMVRYDTQSGTWGVPSVIQAGLEVHSEMPASRPAIAAGDVHLVVVWVEESGSEKQVVLAVSGDGGSSFSDPVVLNRGQVMGRVNIDAAPDDSFYASWMERDGDIGRIYLKKIEQGELATESVYIGGTDPGTGSGFPQIAAMSEGVLMAWTQTDPHVRVRTAFYSYENDERFAR